MDQDSRSKMVRSAAALIAARGLSATSFSEVVAQSGAPRGSIYHHFPEGKAQLAEAAVRATGEHVLRAQRALDGANASEVLAGFTGLWRKVVLASNGASGCAVAGSALDTAPGDALIGVVRATFQAWVELLTEQLIAAGLPPARAGAIALMTVAALEGALILCRAEGSVAPLDVVAAELQRLLPG